MQIVFKNVTNFWNLVIGEIFSSLGVYVYRLSKIEKGWMWAQGMGFILCKILSKPV